MARTTPKTSRYRSAESKRLDWNNKQLFSGLGDERLEQIDARIAKYKAFIDEHEGDEEYRDGVEMSRVAIESAQEGKDEIMKMRQFLTDAKGKPQSAEDAMRKVNPHYGEDGKAYTENCQRCVIAYELQRRGFDVEATAFDGFGKDSKSRHWQSALAMKPEELGAKKRTEVLSKIYDKAQEWGDGSRGILYVAWTRGGAHVVNVEYKKGAVQILDPQSGKYVDWDNYSQRIKASSVTMYRTDNVPVSRYAMDLVKKRGT